MGTYILRIAPLLLLLAGVAPALAQTAAETNSETVALEVRASELQAREKELQSQIREVGGVATSAEGIRNAQSRKGNLETYIWRLNNVAEAYGQNRVDLEQLRQQVASEPIKTLADRDDGSPANSTGKKVAKGIQLGAEFLSGESLGLAPIVGHFVDLGGRYIIRDLNEDLIKQLIESQRVPFVNLLREIRDLDERRMAEVRTVARLQNLQNQMNDNLNELALANRQLASLTGHAHDEANLQRVTDAAGDEEEKRKQQHISVRLCDPREKPRSFGVRLAQKAAGAPEKAGEEKLPVAKSGAGVAVGEACRDIIGFWTVQQTIQVFGKKAGGPKLRAEIVRADAGADTGAVTAYEVFFPDKAKAPSGPIMRCELDGYRLACQRRVQPHVCPPAKYVWAPLDMTIATDVSSISGQLLQTWLMDSDPSGCTLVNGQGQATLGFRFVPAEP